MMDSYVLLDLSHWSAGPYLPPMIAGVYISAAPTVNVSSSRSKSQAFAKDLSANVSAENNAIA